MKKGAIIPMCKALKAMMVVLFLVLMVWEPVDAHEATPPWKSYQSYWAFAQSHPVFDPTEEYSFSSADRAELKDANSSTWAAFIRLSEVQGMVIYEGLLNYLRRFEGEEPLTIDDVVYKPYVESAKNEIKDMLELVGGDTEGHVNDRARAVVSGARTVETLIDLKDVVEVLQAVVEGTAITKAGAKVLRGRAGFMELLDKAKGDAPFIAIDLAMGIARACLEDTVNTGFVYAFRTVADEMPDGEPSSRFIKKATRELIDEYEAQRDARYEALKEETAKWIWESASGAVQTLFLVKPVTFAFDQLFGNRQEAQRDALTAALVSAQMQRAAEVAYQRFRSGNSVDGERRIGDAGLVYLLAAQSANDEYAKLFRELGRVELRERAVEYERKAKHIRQVLNDWVKIGESELSNPHKAAQSTYRGSIAFKDEQGSLVPGVTIRLTGNMNATKSSADGRWSADQLTGEITVRPSKSGYEFKPESQVMTGERPALEFTGKPLQPARPANLTAAATGSQCVELAWENPCDYTQGFEIWRKGESDAEFGRIAKLDYSNDPTLANRWDVQGDATYLYKVRAYNHGAFSDFSDVASATTVKAPADVVAKASSPTHVDLSWVNTSSLPHSVVIERKIGDDGAWQYVDITINASSYTDTRAVSGPINYYRLRATIDGGGVSDWPEEVGATYAYSVSGRVMNENQGVEGAVVTVSGEYFSSSDTVGADGRWQIDEVRGPVIITAAKPGYMFYPVNGASVRVDDTASDIDFYSSISLSGYAIDNAGKGIEGVAIEFRSLECPDMSGTFFTKRGGSWELSGLMGTIRVTASKTGVTFVQPTYELSAPSDAVVFSQAPGERAAGAGEPAASDSLGDTGHERLDGPLSIDGDWSKPHVELRYTPEADLMVRVGDIDLMGLGFQHGYDPFSGTPTNIHRFPWKTSPTDPKGTDTIMVPSSYRAVPAPGVVDGYSAYGIPAVPVTLKYDLGDIQVLSAILQIFLDDVQPRDCKGTFRVTIDGVNAPFLDVAVNSVYQGGPVGYLVTVRVPDDYLYLFRDGAVSILIDDTDTGAGDGYAIDFVRLLINPSGGYSVSGRVMNENQGVEGAVVTASGQHLNSSTTVRADGRWQIDGVRGAITVSVGKPGYKFTISGNRSATVSGTAHDIDFYCSYSVSGHARDSIGNGIEGVTITFRSLERPDMSGTMFTGPDGSWELSGLMGTIIVTASKAGVTFIQSRYEVNAPSDALMFEQTPGIDLNSVVELEILYGAEVVEYIPGNPAPAKEHWVPARALGAPDFSGNVHDCSFVSLGCGGVLVVRFAEQFFEIPDEAEITIYEIGPAVESIGVEVSSDGVTWTHVGTYKGGKTVVDISGYANPSQGFSYVRITDVARLPDELYSGADIDAVSAIRRVNLVDAMPSGSAAEP